MFPLVCETFFCCRRTGGSLESSVKEAAILDEDEVLRFASQKFGAVSAPPSSRAARKSAQKDKEPIPRGKYGSNKAVVLQLQDMAAKLECPVKKFPSLGLGFSQSRYIAIAPIDEDASEFAPSSSVSSKSLLPTTSSNRGALEDKWYHELRMWRRGWLAYWTDQDAFQQGVEPKGHVDIMKIAKVEWTATCPLDVLIRHREAATTHELCLQFDTEEQARDWRENLHQLRALLQRTVKHM